MSGRIVAPACFDDEDMEVTVVGRAPKGGDSETDDESESTDEPEETKQIAPANTEEVPMLGAWGATGTKVVKKPVEKRKQGGGDGSTGLAALGGMMEQVKFTTAVREAKADPYNAQKHITVIDTLMPHYKDDEVWVELDAARVRMSETCALSAKQYATWIMQAKEKGCSLQTAYDILVKATEEFHSVPLYVERCEALNEFLESQLDGLNPDDPSYDAMDSARIEKVIQEYEKCIPVVGSHFYEGHLIWESYRDFFKEEGVDGDDVESVKKYVENYLKLMRRQASLPLHSNSGLQADLDEFTAEHDAIIKQSPELGKMVAAVGRALSLADGVMKLIVPYEEKLVKAKGKASGGLKAKETKEIEAAWVQYIDAEVRRDSGKGLAVAERAILTLPWSVRIWSKAIDAATDAGLRPAALAIANRSTRSLPRSAKLWSDTIRCLERTKTTQPADYTQLYEKCEKVGFRSRIDLNSILEDVVSALQRHPSPTGPQHAMDLCKKHLKTSEDPGLISTLVRFLVTLSSNHTAKGVADAYEYVLTANPHAPSMPTVWEAYCNNLEMLPPTAETLSMTREIYKRGVNSVKIGAGRVAAKWLVFERLHGTAADIDRVRDKYYQGIKKHLQAEADEQVVGDEEDEPGLHQGGDDEGAAVLDKDEAAKQKRTMRKRRLEETQKEARWEQKKAELGLENPTGPPELTAFLWNLPFRADEKDIREFLKGVEVTGMRVIKGKNGVPKGIAYVDVKDEASMQEVLKFDKKKLQNRQVRVQVSNPELQAKPEEESEMKKMQAKRIKRAKLSYGTEGSSNTLAVLTGSKPAEGGGAAKGNSFFKSLLEAKK
eukprot:TRINITY_DN16261_c0_g1_i1.p1 TRINITY_DN16261_c0_g1~~TRINITY_DN16261_c0_g1_i1.p1  ORF type:complete len:832 (+),score=170.03 TRINITY_DN16261_c0_g1_i1:55-2550(+)